jgi:hypothetical protein
MDEGNTLLGEQGLWHKGLSVQATCKTIVSDNGTELTSNAVLVWCGAIGAEWHYIAPVKPMRCISSTAQLGQTWKCRADLSILIHQLDSFRLPTIRKLIPH